jgi:formylglycine-generating enzyme required for sulfatase activity
MKIGRLGLVVAFLAAVGVMASVAGEGGPPSGSKAAASEPAAKKKDGIQDMRSAADRAKDYTETAGGVKIEMVWIPGGTFEMGSRRSSDELAKMYPGTKPEWFNDEHPAHKVELDGFWLGKFEVTNAQFRKFRSSHDSGQFEGLSLNGDDQPVVMVSWNDAKAFCDFLSKATGKQYTLPTEAQWEYACRAGTQTERYWGDDEASMGRYANVADRTAKAKLPQVVKAFEQMKIPFAETDDGYAVSAPVGKFLPNAFDLHDMIGNVWEWCADWYDASYYEKSPSRNPTGPAMGAARVLRGGSWLSDPWYARSACRYRYFPANRSFGNGFRVCRPPSP